MKKTFIVEIDYKEKAENESRHVLYDVALEATIHNMMEGYLQADSIEKGYEISVEEINEDLIIYVNSKFEEERALFDLKSKEVILMGDYYHDKIDEMIEGYLYAKGIDEDEIETKYIDEDHEHYNIIGFEG